MHMYAKIFTISFQKITPLQKDPKQQELGIGEGFC